MQKAISQYDLNKKQFVIYRNNGHFYYAPTSTLVVQGDDLYSTHSGTFYHYTDVVPLNMRQAEAVKQFEREYSEQKQKLLKRLFLGALC